MVEFIDPEQLQAGWQSGGMLREVAPALMDDHQELVIVTQDSAEVYIPIFLAERYIRFLSRDHSTLDQVEESE
jgi:hypothetical protein